MALNLTNQYIDETYPVLVQIDGTILANGTGSAIPSLTVTASSAISASHALLASQSLFAIDALTATYATGSGTAVSASRAVSSQTADLATFATTAATALTATSSLAAVSASYALTASFALNAPLSASYALSASHAVNADTVGLFNKTIIDGTEFQVLRTDGAGNLEFEWADRTYIEARADENIAKGEPVYITGYNAGQNRITVARADASDSNKMPSFGLADRAVVTNGNFQIAALGLLDDVNTQVAPNDFQEGDTLYVASGGGLTNVKPTGTNLIQNVGKVGRRNQNNGEIIASAIGRSNDLPNIPLGNIWAGNASGVPTAIPSSSIVGAATASLLASNNTWTGNNNFGQITASNATFISASIGYLQTVTGSATIIGESIIVLNNDTPTQRYAGLAVYDSGSANTTASLQYDGQTDDWFFEKDVAAVSEFGVSLFGPEYVAKGTPTYNANNKVLKGTGGHHIVDSIITDDGTKVTVGGQFQASGLTGSLEGNALTATTASHALNSDNAVSASYAITASHLLGNIVSASYAVSSSHAITASYALNTEPVISSSYALSSSHALASNTSISASHALNSDAAITSSFAITASYALNSALQVSASYAVTSSHALVADNLSDGNKVLNGTINQTFAAPSVGTQKPQATVSGAQIDTTTFDQVSAGWQDFTFADAYKDSNYFEYFNNSGYNYGLEQTINGLRFDLSVTPEGYSPAPGAAAGNFSLRSLGTSGSAFYAYATDIQLGGFRGKQIQIGNNSGNVYRNTDTLTLFGDSIAVTGHTRMNSVGITIGIGSTSPIDFSLANFFTATMTGATQFTASNIPVAANSGATYQMKIDNTGGHTVTWSSDFKWAGGTAPTLSSGIDIITFASYSNGVIYATGIQNLS